MEIENYSPITEDKLVLKTYCGPAQDKAQNQQYAVHSSYSFIFLMSVL